LNQISKTKISSHTIAIDGQGEEVCLRVMTGHELAAFLNYDGDDFRRGIYSIALSLCDDQGARLYADDELDELLKLPSAVLQNIGELVRKLNGIDDEAIEDAAKN